MTNVVDIVYLSKHFGDGGSFETMNEWLAPYGHCIGYSWAEGEGFLKVCITSNMTIKHHEFASRPSDEDMPYDPRIIVLFKLAWGGR